MLDETNNPLPTDPPTGTGGNTPVNAPEDDLTSDAKPSTDPPTGTGGNGGT